MGRIGADGVIFLGGPVLTKQRCSQQVRELFPVRMKSRSGKSPHNLAPGLIGPGWGWHGFRLQLWEDPVMGLLCHRCKSEWKHVLLSAREGAGLAGTVVSALQSNT